MFYYLKILHFIQNIAHFILYMNIFVLSNKFLSFYKFSLKLYLLLKYIKLYKYNDISISAILLIFNIIYSLLSLKMILITELL